MSASDILTKDQLQKLQIDYRSNKNNNGKQLNFENNLGRTEKDELKIPITDNNANDIENTALSGLKYTNRLPLIMNGKAETPLHFEVNHDLGVLK